MKRAGFVAGAIATVIFTAPRAHAEPATPNVTLAVTPGTGGGPWKLVVTNGGELPVLIAADPRVITLDLIPQNPSAKVTTLRCALPADARPTSDEGRELVVPAKRSWSATFDPLFYCFGAKERAMLVPGTTVKAHLGWPAPLVAPKNANAKKAALPSSPFVVSPVGASVGQLAPMKELEASTFTLTEAVTAAPPPSSAAAASPTPESNESTPAKKPLSLVATEATDVARGVDVPITLTLANESDHAVTTFFRASTLAFTVNGPAGSVSCGSPRAIAEPFRELFTTIGVKGKSSTTLLVSALCPADTFDEPGIYRVVARVDTRGTSGRNIGLKTWDGEVVAKTPALIRVRTPRKTTPPAKKPQLD
jgi:hypothetical protein